jgi:hypothetical protein
MKTEAPIGVIFSAIALAAMLALPFVAPHPGKSSGAPASQAPAAAGATDDGDRQHDHVLPATAPHWYVSVHGEGALAQVFALDGNGKAIGPVLGPLPADEPALDELRGLIALGNGQLAVMNAKSTASRVMLWNAPDAKTGIRPFAGIWTRKDDSNPGMVHPYQIAVGPDGNLYAGNQDTNTITRYGGLGSAGRGKPLALPEGLRNFGTLFPGTVVPNDQQSPDGIGLVRGFAFGPDGNLYVCDRGRDRVAVYDPRTGAYLRSVLDASHGVRHPIQALFTPDGRELLVSDNKENCVFAVTLATGRVRELVKRGEGGLDAASCLAIMGKDLYVGSRMGKKILRYELKDGKFLGVFAELPGNPEFLVPVEQQ